MKYFALLLLIFSLNPVLTQTVQLELDTFNRSIPTANFGGQTWRGPSWGDSVFNDSVSTMYPDVLAYPPSPDVWDWETGWFYDQSFLDTCCVDTITLTWGQLNATVLGVTPQIFQNALNQIDTEGLYCLNMISSTMSKQLADLKSARDNGVVLERIRLGDEMGKSGNELSISHFPTAQDYADACDIFIDSIRDILPNTEIAVSAGNFGASNPRAQYWNDALYNMSNNADAFRWSAFFYLKDADTLFTTKQLLAYAFDQIPTYEKVRCFQDTVSNLQNYELWVGYGISDNTYDRRYANRWSLVLMFSASHHIFLQNKLVEDISMFNVGGIFENWDALDTQNNFRKRATGVFASIWNKAKLNKHKTSPIITPINLMDTVTYYNNNGVPRDLAFPKLFGWRFENDMTNEASVVLTNISNDTLFISIDSLLQSNISWQKWHSDSLFDVIDSVNYIQSLIDTGSTNIKLFPYSINVAEGLICNTLSNNVIESICEGDSLLVGNSIYFTEGIYTDSMFSVDGCDSIIITDLEVFGQNLPTITMSSSVLQTEPLMNDYQWYLNGDSIAGANQFDFHPIASGLYSVSYVDNNNCLFTSEPFLYDSMGTSSSNKPVKKILSVITISGQEQSTKKGFQLEIFDDGSVEKKYGF